MLSWTWKASPPFSGNGTLEWEIGFTSNGTHYDKLSISQIYDSGDRYKFIGYCLGDKCNLAYDNVAWTNSAYRSIIFDTLPDASLYAKLSSMATVDGLISKIEVNGVTLLDLSSDTVTKDTLARGVYAHDKTGKRIRGTMEASSAPNLQSKSVTYTHNGTATVMPDSGYDGLSSVDVTVDVASVSTVSTVTINCEGADSSAFWLSPDGVFHKTNLNVGANTIIVTPYSPIGLYNTYGYKLNNLNNIVNSGGGLMLSIDYTGLVEYYRIYYATATTASATQPTD